MGRVLSRLRGGAGRRVDPVRFVRGVLTVLAAKYPLVYSRIAPFDIVIVDSLGVVASTDGARIFLDRGFVERCAARGDTRALVAVLAHEALHNLLGHPVRSRILLARGVDPRAVNIAADVKVDQYLRGVANLSNKVVEEALDGKYRVVTLERIAEMLRGLVKDPLGFIERSPMERIAELLSRNRVTNGGIGDAGQPGTQPGHTHTRARHERRERQGSKDGNARSGGEGQRGQRGRGGKEREDSREGREDRSGGRGSEEGVEGRRSGSGGRGEGSESRFAYRGTRGGGGGGEREHRQGGGVAHQEDRRGGVGGEFVSVEEGDRLAERGVVAWRGRASERVRELLREASRALERGDIRSAEERLAEALAEAARVSRAIEDVARRLAESIERETSRMKVAGVGEGTLSRVLEELGRGMVDWRSIVRRRVEELLGTRRVRRTWARLNKKLGEVRPGIQPVGGIHKVVATIDVSGSITGAELLEFSEAVLDAVRAAKPRRVVLAWWDWGVRRVVKTTGSLEQVRRELLRGSIGGGGTSITEALQLAKREVEAEKGRQKLVIIASDFYTMEEPEQVARMLEELARDKKTIVVAIVPPKGMVPPVQQRENLLVIHLPEKRPWERAAA